MPADKLDVARLAEQAGMIAHIGKRAPIDTYTTGLANLEHFARLVMEECAAMLEAKSAAATLWDGIIFHAAANALRARMP